MPDMFVNAPQRGGIEMLRRAFRGLLQWPMEQEQNPGMAVRMLQDALAPDRQTALIGMMPIGMTYSPIAQDMIGYVRNNTKKIFPGLSDDELVNLMSSKNEELAVRRLLGGRGINVDKVDIPRFGNPTIPDELRTMDEISGMIPSHERSVNLAVEDGINSRQAALEDLYEFAKTMIVDKKMSPMDIQQALTTVSGRNLPPLMR